MDTAVVLTVNVLMMIDVVLFIVAPVKVMEVVE